MNFTELNDQDIAKGAAAIPEDTPFVMLNLLRYKQKADYGDDSELPACSGKEAYYQRYVPAFAKIAAKSENTKNFKPAFVGSVLASLVGSEDEPWDDVVLVEYGNYAAFREVAESPDYEREAAPHRRAALENWRLIAMHKQPIG